MRDLLITTTNIVVTSIMFGSFVIARLIIAADGLAETLKGIAY